MARRSRRRNPYERISQKEADALIRQHREQPDRYGVNWYEADRVAKRIFGKKGFATYHHRHTMQDPVGPDGYVISTGERYGYSVGYYRKGKRGARLSAKWDGRSYIEAFAALHDEYCRMGRKLCDKITEILNEEFGP